MSIVFFFALSMSVFFVGKLIVWAVQSISPSQFIDQRMTSKEIDIYCLIGTIACVLWAVIYKNRKR